MTSLAVAEARAWVDRHEFGDPWVVILGVGPGNGEHILEFRRRFLETRITVLEIDLARAREFSARENSDALGIEMRVVSAGSFATESLCLEIFEGFPPILCFQPGFDREREGFERLFRLLTGRSREGLECFLRTMGADPSIAEVLEGGRRLLTIKDLGLVVDADKMGHPTASAVRILRELLV